MWLRSVLGKALGPMFLQILGKRVNEVEKPGRETSGFHRLLSSWQGVKAVRTHKQREHVRPGWLGPGVWRTSGQAACWRGKGKADGVRSLGFQPYLHHQLL